MAMRMLPRMRAWRFSAAIPGSPSPSAGWSTLSAVRKISSMGMVSRIFRRLANCNNRDIVGADLQAFLAAARVVQASAEDGGGIEVNGEHIFGKLFAACDQLSLLVENHAAAVED